ncbi:MAG: hypothetical protein EOP06_32175 [Proteobacteria bacterium]|nr:MAG: hypothetical protein EOP06_32175 [Pseudomonadota bacterium]
MQNDLPLLITLGIRLHIFAGALALCCFLIPLFSKKGGRVHSVSGWVYAGGMVLVAVTAFGITPWRYFVDPHRTQASMGFALFLFFISLFALTALQQGLYVFRAKARVTPLIAPGSIILPMTLTVASLAMLYVGFQSKSWLYGAFSLLALRTAYKQVTYWRMPPTRPMHWFFFHLENMFTSCIATVTAFAVTALPRIIPGSRFDSIWIWLAPTLILVPWMLRFIRKYEKKFGVSTPARL